jgi:predicted acetyltransferase
MSGAATPYPISTVTGGDERQAFSRAIALAMGATLDDDAIAHYAGREFRDRFAARDGGQIVGTAVTEDFSLSVPYASAVPCSGVTGVTVQPTHRRRGVMSSLIRHQIDDFHAHGDAWAALYASEAAIYGRFGFGVASRSRAYRIDGPWKRFVEPVPPATIERLDVAQACERIPRIIRAVHEAVPGMLARPDGEWRRRLEWDPESEREGMSARQIVAIGDRAWASYRTKPAWRGKTPDVSLNVEDCMATDPETHRQMWAYLLGIDLVEHVTAGMVAIDDPLPWWLVERHRLGITEDEPFYVRLIGVGGALSQRGTNGNGEVVLDVRDALCPWNAQRWRLEGDGKALCCTATDAAAGVALDVRELASLSLGGTSASELAGAGLIDEHHAGAVRNLDALLASDRAPWNHFIF